MPLDLPPRKTVALKVQRPFDASQKSGTISICIPEQPRRDDNLSSPECVTYQCPSKQMMSPLPTDRPYVDVRPCREANSGGDSLPQICCARRLLSRNACDIRFIVLLHRSIMPARVSICLLVYACQEPSSPSCFSLLNDAYMGYTWAKRRRTLMLLRYRSWVQKRGVKLELRHFPPSRDERSRKERPGRGGREPRREPIPPSEEDNLCLHAAGFPTPRVMSHQRCRS